MRGLRAPPSPLLECRLSHCWSGFQPRFFNPPSPLLEWFSTTIIEETVHLRAKQFASYIHGSRHAPRAVYLLEITLSLQKHNLRNLLILQILVQTRIRANPRFRKSSPKPIRNPLFLPPHKLQINITSSYNTQYDEKQKPKRTPRKE